MSRTSILIWFILSPVLVAGGLELSRPILYSEGGRFSALLNVRWENSWHNNRNHDGVWLFFKFLRDGSEYVHPLLAEEGHAVVEVHSSGDPQLRFRVTEDRVGMFLHPSVPFRGDIHATLRIDLDGDGIKDVNTRDADFSAYGIEVVLIPEGGFTLGDPDTAALAFGAMYRSDASGGFGGLFSISRETGAIPVAPERGALYYRAPQGYEGDQAGPIPDTYPNGIQPFYVMKYEPTQGQYADFLNSLSENQSQHRANFGGKGYGSGRGSISVESDAYEAANPAAPCTFMSWDDAMAFADWAGLRPMTEFEFTKAARGPREPIAGEFPWGSSSKERLQRAVMPDGTLGMLNGWDDSKMTDETLDVFGASFYWVMDLAGSMWERVVTIGDTRGRDFTGSHGDGVLSNYGFATNDDWPFGVKGEGFGFRGGGFYGYGRDYHEFNPFSPIAFRRYGGWSGGNRTSAYGARFVRSAN